MNSRPDDHAAKTAAKAVWAPLRRRTAVAERALLIGLLLVTLGTLTSRVDLVLLAIPLLISTAIGADQRLRIGESSTVLVALKRPRSVGNDRLFEYRVVVVAPSDAEFVHLRIVSDIGDAKDLVLSPHVGASFAGEHIIRHSGRQQIAKVSYRLIGADGAWISEPSAPVVAERSVAPAVHSLKEIASPFRLTGLAGARASARPGDGGEFRDLHHYAPGDRLRRIDWKATARRSHGFGDLLVRRTDATADATVILVLDSRDDICERVEGWSGAFLGDGGLDAMDLAREAAASLAVAAVGAGDRVGFIDVAAQNGVLSPAGGKRHLDRVLRCIAMATPSGVRFSQRRAPIVPRGAIIYLMSTFFDFEVVELARLWRAAGHRVIAVDVLPILDMQHCSLQTRTAQRILLAERRQHLAAVHANGGECFRWQDNADRTSRAIALRTLARAGRRR
jgi:uncharacterized protein (DUF58 family)